MSLLQKAKHNNTLFGNSFLIFMIRFFPSLATLIVVILFSRNISETEYGNYQNFWVQLFLFSALATMGLPALFLTYTPSFVKKLLSSLTFKEYSLILVWMVLITIVFVIVRVSSSAMPWHIPFCFFLLYVLNAVSESMLVVFRQFTFLLWVNIFYAGVFIWLHFGVLYCIYDITTLFVLLLLPGMLKLLGSAIYIYRSLEKTPIATEQEYSRKDIRSLWLHVGIYDVLQRIFSWVDKFAISILFSAGISAIYFNGTFDVPFLPLLLGAVSSAALLQMAAFSQKGDAGSSILIANQTARLLSAIVFPLFFFLFLFREELFTVLLTDKYAESVPIFAVTVLIVPLRAYNFTSILQNKHKGYIINKGAILDLVIALALMYPLYHVAGLSGIAASFVISSYIQGAYYLYHTAKVLNTSVPALIPIRNWLVKLPVFGILFFICHYLLAMLFPQEMVLILGSLVLAVVSLLTIVIELRSSK